MKLSEIQVDYYLEATYLQFMSISVNVNLCYWVDFLFLINWTIILRNFHFPSSNLRKMVIYLIAIVPRGKLQPNVDLNKRVYFRRNN